jgi:hypothetical protein
MASKDGRPAEVTSTDEVTGTAVGVGVVGREESADPVASGWV